MKKIELDRVDCKSFNQSIDRALEDSGVKEQEASCDTQGKHSKNLQTILQGFLLGIFVTLSIICFSQGLDTGNYASFISITFISLGLAANTLVIMTNGGKMPVKADLTSISEELQSTYSPIEETTRFRFLADCIPISQYLISVGDVLILFGALALWTQRFF